MKINILCGTIHVGEDSERAIEWEMHFVYSLSSREKYYY